MTASANFTARLEAKVTEQLHAQRVCYLLGAGSSYLGGTGYPLASHLWDQIKDRIDDSQSRSEIQHKLDAGASGIEQALDLLDDGSPEDTPYRHLVTSAIADVFRNIEPELDLHIEFSRRISRRADPCTKVFSLNYDPLVERASEAARVRAADGFVGAEHAFFDAAVFEERIGQIRGTHKGRQFDETVRPIHLFKLHGSIGWYECVERGVRRCAFGARVPPETKLLMVPPQHRKAADTTLPPYSALWSAFRGHLCHDSNPANRLACFGYGFADEHVNAVIEAALARTDFSLVIFAKDLTDTAWDRWSTKTKAIVATENRCSLKGELGPGHPDLWRFERLCKEV